MKDQTLTIRIPYRVKKDAIDYCNRTGRTLTSLVTMLLERTCHPRRAKKSDGANDDDGGTEE